MLDNTSFRQVDIKIQGHVCGKRGTETYVSLVVLVVVVVVVVVPLRVLPLQILQAKS